MQNALWIFENETLKAMYHDCKRVEAALFNTVEGREIAASIALAIDLELSSRNVS